MTQKILLNALDVGGVARNLDGELFVNTSVDADVGDVVELVVRLPRGQTVALSVAVVARQPWTVDREPGLLLRPLDDGDPLPGILHDLSRGRLHAAEQRLAARDQSIPDRPLIDGVFADAFSVG